jgi:hypothetical protein
MTSCCKTADRRLGCIHNQGSAAELGNGTFEDAGSEAVGFKREFGGDGGIRTLDRALQPYNGLANRRLQPLGHISGTADMPDAGAGRKRQIDGL